MKRKPKIPYPWEWYSEKVLRIRHKFARSYNPGWEKNANTNPENNR